MGQYQTGTVKIIHGSNIVAGFGTSWLENVRIGDSFMVEGINVYYQVASVDSDTQITLSEPWSGPSMIN